MSNQDRLLDFVNDPENIAKAAEASMDKRNKAMSQDRLLSDEELEKKVLNLLKIYRQLPTAACERRIVNLINTQKRLYAEPYKSLLKECIEPMDDECSYDHHGYCQAHFLHDNPCPYNRAKKLLAESKD